MKHSLLFLKRLKNNNTLLPLYSESLENSQISQIKQYLNNIRKYYNLLFFVCLVTDPFLILNKYYI